jgi:hypothetical protein
LDVTVEEVYPDLVVKDRDGRVVTIHYQKPTPMLLTNCRKNISTHNSRMKPSASLQARLATLEALVGGK